MNPDIIYYGALVLLVLWIYRAISKAKVRSFVYKVQCEKDEELIEADYIKPSFSAICFYLNPDNLIATRPPTCKVTKIKLFAWTWLLHDLRRFREDK